MQYSDEDLLNLVRDERRRSIGWGDGDSGELRDEREKSIDYYKGKVDDVPAMANRSKAVSTDVAEAVETALPDLLEIFIGGDDVATFQAHGEEDEDAALQESEYVKHVILNQNPGVLNFYTVIKDALLCRTGIFHWYWTTEEEDETLAELPADAAEALKAVADAQGMDLEVEEGENGLSEVSRKRLRGCVKVIAIPPEDFTVGQDTVELRTATYCGYRARPRIQELIAGGIDAEKARALKPYTQTDEQIAEARDEAGENSLTQTGGTGDLRQVEVRYHYIRVLSDDERDLELWKVVTDAEETTLLEKEEVEGCIPFGPITPYINAHRFYGESLADKLMEIQRIKTTLLRMFLDSGYFALNQRNYVNMDKTTEFTISDLLRNEPNMPVRGRGDNAVVPLGAGGLTFDALAALEHVSVMGEQRTGIVRNAQGLNPDTLHDTAKGMMNLFTAAQKRLRLIARIFAETGIRDLYLGVHELLRAGYSNPGEGAEYVSPAAKLSKGWASVDPKSWPERKELDVQVGVGSAGREHDMIALTQVMNVQKEIAMAGVPGVVKPDNIYNAAKRFAQVANLKTPESLFSDPAKEPPQPPQPPPEVVKAQMQIEADKQKAAGQLQLEQQKGAASLQQQDQKAQREHELAIMRLEAENQLQREKVAAELALKRETTAAELEMKRELLVAELQMKRELGIMNAQVAHETGMAKVAASSSVSEVNTGGDPG